MDAYRKKVMETVDFLKKKAVAFPEIGFLTGTGLGSSTDSIDVGTALDYREIPNFPVSTVESHSGKLLSGTLAGKFIIAMQGRFHLYEGYSPLEVTFPVRVMQELGVKYLVISNASGGINLEFSAGEIMIITDHINLTGKNPLAGPNVDAWGIRFPDMIDVYDAGLATLAGKVAKANGLRVHGGTYAGLLGPSLETPAETRYLQRIGADAVGFSTVMEAIVGVHAGMKILGLATITNINNPDSPEKATVEEIIKTAGTAAAGVDAVLRGVVERI